MRKRENGSAWVPEVAAARTGAADDLPSARQPTAHERSISELPRDAEDDFFCLRFRVWYASIDCAYRTRFETSPGCLQCEQGRFNLKRHQRSVNAKLYRLPVCRERG